MDQIIEKTVTQKIYLSGKDGRETPLEQMENAHLVNAFGQACDTKTSELNWSSRAGEQKKLVDTLRTEILRRLAESTI